MRSLKKFIGPSVSIFVLTGCAGLQRGCQSQMAQTFGADWIVAQMGQDGKPAHCWLLRNASVANEDKSDGVHWLGQSGHLVHISGWIDRVQVYGGDYASAAREIGITDVNTCAGAMQAR